MKLLSSQTSPFVRKVRVVLAEKDIACEIVPTNVVPLHSEAFAFSPLGQVPCLLLDDGMALYDSTVIVEYLDAMNAGSTLVPATSAIDRAVVKCWESLADGVLDAGLLIRWELSRKSPQYRDPEWLVRKRLKISSGLNAMSLQLGDNEYCFGDSVSLADLGVGVALAWLSFRFPEIEWRKDHSNLERLLVKLEQRPSFQNTKPA